MSNYNRIILKERVRIEAGIYAKKSFGEIAEELGRSTSSITREVRQNRIMVKSPYAYKSNYINNPLAADRLRYDVLFHTDLSRDHGNSNGLDLGRINWGNYDLVWRV